ncbi:FAD/NAD(P)-binding protein [Brevundimonas balnearis]|uniref:FAD/NAD(P)-binding protein n=1 Tax=Brevundimonas balnearis TaxID=1572858 RepID=A0ABV6R2N3_9CAUL
MSDRVLIIGGGFSGAMLAARLAERGAASTLINRDDRFGLGVAYGAAEPWHLLNVRSARMSAVADRPDDFVDWLRLHAPEHSDPHGFAPRVVFGRYVQDRLNRIRRERPQAIEAMSGVATAIGGDGVDLADGRRLQGRAVVLSTGNPPPAAASALPGAVADPWALGALEGVRPSDDVVLIGTGLTMVDVLATLERRGWFGRAFALSRRGLLPRSHGPRPDPRLEPAPGVGRSLAGSVKAARDAAPPGDGWRSLMEAYRPITAELWASLDARGQRRLLRHLRPWWDVHRHRLAPEVAARIDSLIRQDRLSVMAGRLLTARPAAGRIELSFRPRSQTREAKLVTDWLIDCSGPGHDPRKDPLTGPLIAAGAARLHANGLGLDLDPFGRVLNAQGLAHPDLYVLGPPARAAFWETIAVPDIRERIEAMARALSPPS